MIGLLLGIVFAESLLLFALYGAYKEQAAHVAHDHHELELAREEIHALMESIARGSRTPIQFGKKPQVLEKGESYFEKALELVSINHHPV
jgi:hypothetical protein